MRCAVIAAALFASIVAPVFAQSSNLRDLFNDLPCDTTTPDVLYAPFNQPRLSVGPGESSAGGPTHRLRQPERMSQTDESRLVQPAAAENRDPSPETLPSPRVEGTLPMAGWDADVSISQGHSGRIERLVVRDASLSRVLALLAQTYHLNIVAANDIDAVISITLQNVALEEALTAILSVANYTWVDRNGIILITSLSDSAQLPPDIQGRQIQVFELDFASANVISEAVSGFLSPIGKLAVTTTDSADNRRTREMIVVEDIPESIARIANYIYQVDQPPRQVLLEAHILQVTLKDTEKCGVDFDAILRAAGSTVTLKTVGFAPTLEETSSGTGFFATVEGGDLQSVIEILQTTTDAKALASPKLLVLNGQEAEIQVGETIYFSQTTTTQTSSQEGAASVETGTILHLTPRITRDGRILLQIEPEVSEPQGERPDPSLPPNIRTIKLQSDVMLENGQGMVIGGLISEKDSTNQSKIPYLGDLWRAGFLFRKSEVAKERVEIIVAIVPRIQPYECKYQDYEQGELIRAQTPLFQGPLCYTDRPWEPRLPDGIRVAKPYIPPPPNRPQIDRRRHPCEAPWPPYYVPRKPFPEQRPCDDGGLGVPVYDPEWPQPDYPPDYADEFSAEFGEELPMGGAIISDQP